MTPEEYTADYNRRMMERIAQLRGRKGPLPNEVWEAMPHPVRARENAAVSAAAWLEDYKDVIEALVEMTGESRETMTAFYFGLDARRVVQWIETLRPFEQPKEPWQP